MLNNINTPFVQRKNLHKRSKTITILYNTQKQNKITYNSHKEHKKSKVKDKKSLSTNSILMIQPYIQPQATDKEPVINKNNEQTNNKFKISNLLNQKNQNQKKDFQLSSLKKMTQQIQKLINRQLASPQLLTYVHRGSSRINKKYTQPQHSKSHYLSINSNDTQKNSFHSQSSFNYPENQSGYGFNFSSFNEQNNNKIFPDYSSINTVRQEEYLKLVKRAQNLNSKSFVPHFNWKQKLSKLKNMGNYGHVYKKNTLGGVKDQNGRASHLRRIASIQQSGRKRDSNQNPTSLQKVHQIDFNNQIQNSLLQETTKKMNIQGLSSTINRRQKYSNSTPKKLSNRRCYTTDQQYFPYPKTSKNSKPQQQQKQKQKQQPSINNRYLNLKKRFSQTKYGQYRVISRSPQGINKDWNFQPWEVKRQQV